ncbi:unnamed protein product, partial [Prorocentrum cordatum]
GGALTTTRARALGHGDWRRGPHRTRAERPPTPSAQAQKHESARAEEFDVLRKAKTAQIEAGEKMEEQKEDELAKTANDLAEAKEDLGQEKALLSENQAFLKNMKETCAEADKNWEQRKKARQDEMEGAGMEDTCL